VKDLLKGLPLASCLVPSVYSPAMDWKCEQIAQTENSVQVITAYLNDPIHLERKKEP
jgi:hypothetical protein